jgi:hypothetical protein
MPVTEHIRARKIAERHLINPTEKRVILEIKKDIQGLNEEVKRLWNYGLSEDRQIKRWFSKRLHNLIAILIHRERNFDVRLNPSTAWTFESLMWEVIPFSLIYTGTCGRWDSVNYRYYSQKEGCYDINTFLRFARLSMLDTFDKVDIALYKNGLLYKYLDYIYQVTGKIGLHGSCNVYLNENDYIDIRLRHGNLTNWFYKEGNENIDTIDYPYAYFDIHFSGNNCYPTTPPT